VCVYYQPLAIYTTTTDGAVVTRVVDSGGDPAFMPACNLPTCLPNTISITIETNPAGLQITIDGVTSVAPQIFDWVPGSSHTIATNSPQGAGGTRNVFASWSDAGAISHSVAPTVATTFTANFEVQYLLTTGVSPGGSGSITTSPSSGDGFYDSGAPVQLTATPIAGFTFAGFSGDLAGVTNPQFVVMNAPKTVIANFSSTFKSTMHIGDLDGTRTNQQNVWTAVVTITLHDSNHGPVANATVSGAWSIGGTASCTTDSTGQCFVSKSAIPRNTKSVVFTIVNATNSTFLYRSADNHDPDGDSNGTTVSITRP
jgi:List-Bact-rpt repeat protein